MSHRRLCVANGFYVDENGGFVVFIIVFRDCGGGGCDRVRDSAGTFSKPFQTSEVFCHLIIVCCLSGDMILGTAKCRQYKEK